MFMRNKRWFFFNADGVGTGGDSAASPPSGDTSSSPSFDMGSLFNIGPVSDESPQDPASAGAGKPTGDQQQQGSGAPSPDNSAQQPVPMAQPGQQTPDPAAELAHLRGQLEAWRQAAQMPRQQQPQPQAQQQQPTRPQFPVRLPPEVIQALGAEDPGVRQQAFEYLGQELGSEILHQTQQQTQAVIRQLANAIPQVISSMINQHQQLAAFHNDFYKEHPYFGQTPEFRQYVGQLAQQLAGAGKITKLDKAARDLLAQAVFQSMGVNPGQQRPAQPPQQQQRRPTIANNGARQMPNGSPNDPNSAAGIFDLIS